MRLRRRMCCGGHMADRAAEAAVRDSGTVSDTPDIYVHGHHESVLRSHTWRTVENSAAYLKGWASKLRDEPKALLWAASRAQKAVDLIITTEAQALAA